MQEREWVLKRGDIVFANLNPSKGQEFGKYRPVIILSSDEDIRDFSTVMVVPLSSQVLNSDLPHRVFIAARSMLAKDSDACVNEIRSIDQQRILEKLASISDVEFAQIKSALFELLS